MSQRSNSENSFNFDLVIDYSVAKKDRTGQLFKQQYDFDQFKNIGDSKTIKTQSRKLTNSDFLKKSFDSNLIPSDNQINKHLNTPTNTQTNFKSKNIHMENMERSAQNFRSPKFGQPIILSEQPSNTNNQSQGQMILQPIHLRQPIPKNKQINKSNESLYNRDKNYSQQQYKHLCDQINFYNENIQKLVFEGRKVNQANQQIESKLNNQITQEEVKYRSEQIQKLNNQIERERNIQVKLTQVRNQVAQQYQQLVKSTLEMQFTRPITLNNETKLLIDDINSLKAELQSFYRDQATLNLSTTLQNQQQFTINNSRYDKFSYSYPDKAANQLYTSMLEQIYDQQKKSQDPKFLYNIKMCCLKDTWCIYSNNFIQINVHYNIVGDIEMSIGNKTSYDLNKFTIKEENKSIQSFTLAPRNFFKHYLFKVQSSYQKPFICIKLQYLINNTSKQIKLFVPNMKLKHGQWIACTKREFQNQLIKQNNELTGNYRPFDQSIIKSLNEISIYFSNIFFGKCQNECYGMFQNKDENSKALILMKQRDELLKICVINGSIQLMKTLQFILTI